jgi:starch phosphorylase
VTVRVHLGDLDPRAVGVELYADPGNDGQPERHPMSLIREPDDASGAYEYSVSISGARALGDYTPRLVPRHPDAAIPLEAAQILWQR